MTAFENEATPTDLLLAGYVALGGAGFALPCYATGAQANAWNVAVCSVDGDHAGTVVGFDVYEGEGVVLLPEHLRKQVAMAAPWQDVFLWDAEPIVGTPAVIFERLRPDFDHVIERIPISALDLALAAGAPDVSAFAEAAGRYVARRHGDDAAATWRRDVLLKGEVRLAMRRLLAAAGADREIVSGVRPVVVERRGGYEATLTSRASEFLVNARLLDEARHSIGRVARAVGSELRLAVRASEARDPEAWEASVSKAYWPGDAVRILVVAIGSRAGAIARHVSAPDWVPTPHAPAALSRWIVRKGRKVDGTDEPSSIVDVVEGGGVPPSVDVYAAVVWLIDDELLDELGGGGAVGDLFAYRSLKQQTVHLLAPALPLLTPSRALSSAADGGLRVPACHAVIDTSLARSPFWTGNPWRAIDRRIADVAVATALLCAMEGPIRAELLSRRPAGPPRIASVALGRGELDGSDPGLGLASESSATGLLDDGGGRLDVAFGLTPLDKSARDATRGYASLRSPDADFDVFARAAVSAAVKPEAGSRRSEVQRSGLDPVARRAEGPKPPRLEGIALSAGVIAGGSMRLIVTGEAPSLEAIRAASDEGWGVVRYTDRETIVELLRDPEASPALPRELRLPGMRRLSTNRGLAVRGVDPRDVVRLPAEHAEAWLTRWTDSKIAASARRYLARADQTGPGELAFPRADVTRGVADGDEGAVAVAAGEKPEALGRPLKRPTDLRAAWTPPQSDVRRYVVEDGRIPAEVVELGPTTVPAQRMFLLDGDVAVPFLLSSRLFAVWARATTSWSTSWLSRFSVSRTFETLPIPPCFELAAADGVRPILRLAGGMVDLDRIARWLSEELPPERRWRRSWMDDQDGERIEGAWRDVDRILLDAIDLPFNAGDVDVLERLLLRAS